MCKVNMVHIQSKHRLYRQGQAGPSNVGLRKSDITRQCTNHCLPYFLSTLLKMYKNVLKCSHTKSFMRISKHTCDVLDFFLTLNSCQANSGDSRKLLVLAIKLSHNSKSIQPP